MQTVMMLSQEHHQNALSLKGSQKKWELSKTQWGKKENQRTATVRLFVASYSGH